MDCASLTVTFHPDAAPLVSQLLALPPEWPKLLVDNGTHEASWRVVKQAISGIPGVQVIRLGSNRGLAAAQNEGIRLLARRGDVTHVLLLDQDSEPQPQMALELAEAFVGLERSGWRVGAVGPSLVDPVNGVRHGFHCISGWRWMRVSPVGGDPLQCAGLNGSGTFMALEIACTLGGMDDELFIDMVDAEWSFRIVAAGFVLFGVPKSTLLHRMGDRTTRLWLLGWRVWPIRSPLRHRYLFRNTVLLLRRPYVPRVWKFWAAVKLPLTAAIFGLLGPHRIEQLNAMARGVIDGLRGRTGAL